MAKYPDITPYDIARRVGKSRRRVLEIALRIGMRRTPVGAYLWDEREAARLVAAIQGWPGPGTYERGGARGAK